MNAIPTDKVISCFYETSDDCVKVVDTHGILMSFNNNGLKVMEIDNERDVIGKSWLSFWKGDLKRPAEEAFNAALRGMPSRFEGFCPTFKGTMKYWEVSIVPLMSDTNKVQSLLVTSRDTTRMFDLENRVHELEARLEDIQSS